MTEEGWLSSLNAGVMLRVTKRSCRLPPLVVGRKYRLAALAFVQELPNWDTDPQAVKVLATVEQYCDRGGSYSQIGQWIRREYPPLLMGDVEADEQEPLLAKAVRSLGDPDAYSCAFAIASDCARWADHEGQRWTEAYSDRVRDIFGNPFRQMAFDPKWRTEAAVGLALKMYDDRDFRAMPILADALEEAGCDVAELLAHCREPGVHVRGCWVVDLVLGKG